MKQKELKVFGEYIQKEIHRIEKSHIYSKKVKMEKMSTLKDVIFLLGISIDKEKYNWQPGFNQFWEDLGLFK